MNILNIIEAQRHAEAIVAQRDSACARASLAESDLRSEQVETDRLRALVEAWRERCEMARGLATQLFDMLDDNARCEVVEGFAAMLADYPDPEEE